MKHKTFARTILFSALTAAGIHLLNTKVDEYATSKGLLKSEENNYFIWKNLKIFYTQKGTIGSPVILIHNLDPSASTAEWEKLENILSRNHRVYSLDLLGCGRSDKPDLTYTSFYFVQLIIDFIKQRVCEKSFVIASGFSSSIVLMASVYDASKFSGILLINPPSINSISQFPNSSSKISKKILELPLIGSLLYNILYAREVIDDSFTEDYLYNPFLVSTKLIDTYYESAHLGKGNGKFLQASISGRYLNMNIEHALKNSKVHTDILIGSILNNEDFISRVWKKLKPEIKIYSVDQAKNLPHYEKPDLTCEIIEKSIEAAKLERNRQLDK